MRPAVCGRIVWTPGVTRMATDVANEAGVSGILDTVTLDGVPQAALVAQPPRSCSGSALRQRRLRRSRPSITTPPAAYSTGRSPASGWLRQRDRTDRPRARPEHPRQFLDHVGIMTAVYITKTAKDGAGNAFNAALQDQDGSGASVAAFTPCARPAPTSIRRPRSCKPSRTHAGLDRRQHAPEPRSPARPCPRAASASPVGFRRSGRGSPAR